ncbi:23S rRNA (guanosine(2251)-2'-O)-methyltransferase RlmB [Pelagibacterales bacterium SAG-MED15]|nr:23S rRNA (guanosine(2251)-2'-O)-methyltransferase RlmB [Pelagibacterales bacterium SAG-MED15]
MNKSSFFIVGKHAVIEALKNPKRKVLRIFLTEESKKSIHRASPKKNLLKDLKIFFKTKRELDKYSNKDGLLHQGFVAEIEHLDEISLNDYIKMKNNLNLICLDEVSDARNIGSIIRSGASFDLDGLIVKERHFPSESKLLYKSASGAMEHIKIFQVSNINTTLKNLREKNFWVYGFDASGNKDFTEYKYNGNNILLFGSEGYGISKHTLNYTDYLVKIKMNTKIESLNISNSASIVFHHVKKFKSYS